MAERAKTGAPFLDAWLDAMAPLAPLAVAPGSGFPGWADIAASIAGSWSEISQRSLGAVNAIGDVAGAGDPLGEALERSFGVVGEIGGAGAHVATALADMVAVTGRLTAARESYRALMMATWQRALEEISTESLRVIAAGNAPATQAQWLGLAIAIADRVFVEKFNSPAYLEAQRRLSSALADQRRSEGALFELFAQTGHVPTRGAMDELCVEVSDLRRRLRRLERQARDTTPPRRAGKKHAR